MTVMLAELPEGESPGILFQANFLSCLPADIKRQLCAKNLPHCATWPSMLTGFGMVDLINLSPQLKLVPSLSGALSLQVTK